MTKKEFIEKWSNYWMLWSNRTLLTEAFEKELNLIIEQENLILEHPPINIQASCITCKFLDTKYDHYCSGCIKFTKYEHQETLR